MILHDRSEDHFFDSLNEFMESNELIYSLDLMDASYRAEITPERFASFIIDFFGELDVIYSRAIQGDKWNSTRIISEAAQVAQNSATSATRRSSIPPEMLGRSTPHIGTQAFTTNAMGPLANDSPSRRAITVNEHDPYQDVPPIDVEPTPGDFEDVVPTDPSRGEPQLYYRDVHAFVDEFLTQIYDLPLGTSLYWFSLMGGPASVGRAHGNGYLVGTVPVPDHG